MMIEPYFNVWLKTRNDHLRKGSFGDFCESWKSMTRFERFVFSGFLAFASALLLSTLVFVSNQALFPWYGLCYAAFLLLYAGTNRVLIERDRRLPQRKLKAHAEFDEAFAGLSGMLG